MTDLLVGLTDAVAALRGMWPSRGVDRVSPLAGLDGARLVAVTEALCAVGRRLDAIRSHVAAEVAHRSRAESGPESLAKKNGHRSPAAMIAATGGIGTTDLDNGVLLCEACHHRIHDNGWEIRIEGRGAAARVWFIPPPDIDPARTPRLGGRARYRSIPAA